MWKVTVRCLRWTAGLYILLAAVGVAGLMDIQVTVPEAIPVGETASLQCHYDLESDILYSLKWYKGKQEFFRYIPKELPHTKVFPLAGVNVDIGRSGPGTVVLRGVPISISGRYRCEVSADAPSFHTMMKSSYMHVVDLPKSAPVISAEKTRISIGDTLRVRCIAPPAHPPANLTWFLNNIPVKGTPIEPDTIGFLNPFNGNIQVISTNNKLDENNTKAFGNFDADWDHLGEKNKIIHKRSNEFPKFADSIKKQYDLTGDNRQDILLELNKSQYGKAAEALPNPLEEKVVKKKSASALEITIGQESFHQGRLTLTCRATVFSLYDAQAHLILEGEKPQIASVLGTRGNSSGFNKTCALSHWLYLIIIINLIKR